MAEYDAERVKLYGYLKRFVDYKYTQWDRTALLREAEPYVCNIQKSYSWNVPEIRELVTIIRDIISLYQFQAVNKITSLQTTLIWDWAEEALKTYKCFESIPQRQSIDMKIADRCGKSEAIIQWTKGVDAELDEIQQTLIDFRKMIQMQDPIIFEEKENENL